MPQLNLLLWCLGILITSLPHDTSAKKKIKERNNNV